MGIIDEIRDHQVWLDFLRDEEERGMLSEKELRELRSFTAEKRYATVVQNMVFSLPERKEITRLDSARKRSVYVYPDDETWVLKLIARLLYRYDGIFSDHCYAFRRSLHASDAFRIIRGIDGLNEMFVLKADIHDYFNSIDTDLLLDQLKQILSDDIPLYEFFAGLLTQDAYIQSGTVHYGKRGAMAGVPTANFFANVCLMDLDRYFDDAGIPYFRYSDDILILARNSEDCLACLAVFLEHLSRMHLTVNPDKLMISAPGETWTFLGFSMNNGEIDLAEPTIRKMKGRIRRKAHKLYRRRRQNGMTYERAAHALIRSMDEHFYSLSRHSGYSWTGYYFPVITVTDGLHRIDETMISYLRWLSSGRHYKGNFRITYDELKRLGYTPLKAEYYRWRKERISLERKYEESG